MSSVKHRSGRALHKRYGRTMGPQAISRPVPGTGPQMYRVVLVDGKGRELRTIAKRVPYLRAVQLIAEGS